MEGVDFIVSIEKGYLKVRVDDKDKEYLSDLNEKKWLETAKDFALDNDIFEGFGGEELTLKMTDGKLNYEGKKQPKPVAIKVMKAGDIFSGLTKL